MNLLEKNLAFNLAGHVNHSVFWPDMSPDGGDKPDGELAAAILPWDSLGQRLIIEQLYDHQGNLVAGSIPLLLLDMWEHAFHLQYRNVKADYVTAWWSVANWADVTRRFTAARAATSGLIAS